VQPSRSIGQGLLESAYEECLCFELHERGITHARQVPLPIVFKGHRLDAGYRMDIIVEQQLIVEVKSVDQLIRLHEAQVLTYLRRSGLQTGLLLNFNTVLLKHGLRRYKLSSSARSAVDLLPSPTTHSRRPMTPHV
jgi:GxxExxY protein